MAGRRVHPPKLVDGDDFEEWEREIEIWKLVTDVPEERQGASIYLSLEGKARACCKTIEIEKLKGKNGADELLKKLRDLYSKDKEQSAFKAYEDFENYQRPENMNITDFLNEWERRYEKIKSKEMALPDGVLAYRLLKSTNVSAEKQQLVRATVSTLTLDNMKKQIKAIFDRLPTSETVEGAVKLEQPTMFTEEEEDVLYSRFQRGRGFRGNRGGQNVHRGAYRGGSRGQFQRYRKTNPPTSSGLLSNCAVCQSILHWAKDCPDKDVYKKEEDKITMFAKDIEMGTMSSFVFESFNKAVLDSGCSKTVCGRVWYDNFVKTLSPKKREDLEEKTSNSTFRFGDGKAVNSTMTVKIPVCIGKREVNLQTDVVEVNVPLLLSKQAMKTAETKLDFANDSVSMFGENINLSFASSGHYMIPLYQKVDVLLTTTDKDRKKSATKLHLQFGHAPSHKTIQLLKDAGQNDADYFKLIDSTVSECDVCKQFQKSKSRPTVGFSLARDFNDVVSMDLKFIQSHGIIHLIDNATRFSAAAVIKSKKKEEIVEKIFMNWIQLFGCPGIFFSDNGGEFNNDLLRELGELLNTKILTTAAESPWSNGITERHNAIIGGMVEKVMADINCSLEVALAWSVSAKNSLKNVYGFSPNQLVFGKKPNIPTVLNSELPALEGVTSSQLISEHLNAMHASRKAFIQCEASDKLKRALLKKTRTATIHEFKTGNEVYYKKKDSRRWHGPGIVIGGINKQVFVKHGGSFLRVNPCNLQHVTKQGQEARSTVLSENVCDVNPKASDDNVLCDSFDDEETIEENELYYDTVEHNEQQSDETVENGHEQQNEENNTSESMSEENDEMNQVQNITEDKEPYSLRCLRPFNNPGSKENNHVLHTLSNATTDKNPSSSVTCVLKLPAQGSRIKYMMAKDDKWSNAYVVSQIETNSDILYVQEQNDQVKTLKLSELKEWEYVNEEILAVNHENQEVLEAKLKEIDNLRNHNVFTEESNVKKPAIDVRWVITEKFQDGQKKTKARLVAKGFQENSEVRTDSPTCLKENLRLVATIAVSKDWKIKSLDIKSAFLQGKDIDREVYLVPPQEIESRPNILWKLNKTIYGLNDASRKWYLKVKETLENLGVTMSIYDEALFYYKEEGKLDGLIGTHVDDFLYVGSNNFEEKVIDKVREVFEISKESSQSFNHLGLEIGESSSYISFSQSQYIDELTAIQNENVTETEIKSKIGQLAWIANQTRPDIAFEVCQASVATKDGDSQRVNRINKCVKRLKSQQTVLKFIPIDFETAKIVSFADAAFANLTNGGSQGGFIVFLVNENRCVPMFWQSKALKRVVKSTLSAETMAAMEGGEYCFMLKTMLKEILDEKLDLPIYAFTDSKSLKDSVYSTKTLSDKRLKVDICVIRDYLRKKEIKEVCWIATEKQLADSLTKAGANSAKLLAVLNSSRLELEL